MSIQINKNKCIGCGKCMEVCPGNLLERDSDNKAIIKYPKDCWGCTSCIKECPKNAIEFFLGADIGGEGTITTATVKDNIISWNVKKTNGDTVTIDINSKEANKY